MPPRTASKRSEPPVRVFIGTSAGGEDAEACMALAHSIRSRASRPVDIRLAALSKDSASPFAGWQTQHWSTPWTALRWAVPDACGHEGLAVYFDAPTIVLGDVAALVADPLPGDTIVRARRDGASLLTACLVFDCARAAKWISSASELAADPGAHVRAGGLLTLEHPELAAPLPDGWGLRDIDYSRAPEAVTGSVHYAQVGLQPHQRHARARLARTGREHWFRGARLPHYSPALIDLFERELAAASKAGTLPEQFTPEPEYGPYDIIKPETVP